MEDLMKIHEEAMEILGWDEATAWDWIGTPAKELDLQSPAELVLLGNTDTVMMFLAGARKAMEKV